MTMRHLLVDAGPKEVMVRRSTFLSAIAPPLCMYRIVHRSFQARF